jgi:hypothetical protein
MFSSDIANAVSRGEGPASEIFPTNAPLVAPAFVAAQEPE